MDLFKKNHTIPNVNITLNKQKLIFSKIWYLFNATTSITGEWWYEYMPLIECELLTLTRQACIQKGTYAAACLGLYYQCLNLRKAIADKIAELDNKKG